MVRGVESGHGIVIPAFGHNFRMRVQEMSHNFTGDILAASFSLVCVNKMNGHTPDLLVMMIGRKIKVIFNIGLERFFNRHMVGVNFEIHCLNPISLNVLRIFDPVKE